MIELEIFNSDYGDKVEPVVSIGTEEGEWTYTLNSIHIKQFLRAINEIFLILMLLERSMKILLLFY